MYLYYIIFNIDYYTFIYYSINLAGPIFDEAIMKTKLTDNFFDKLIEFDIEKKRFEELYNLKIEKDNLYFSRRYKS